MSYGNTHGKHEKPQQKTSGRFDRADAYKISYSEERVSQSALHQNRRDNPPAVADDGTGSAAGILRNVIVTILVVASVSVLVAFFKMPVIRVYGDAMTPLVKDGDTIVGIRGAAINQGDVVGVYYGNKLLTKRCIAVGGQKVNMDESGNVFVDGNLLNEPYVVNKADLKNNADIELPFEVPRNHIFVLGDNRSNPADSRNTDVGCFKLEDVCGRLIFRIWPLPMKTLN